ncbi:hypothetical protein TNCV_1921561 [Trichonephila clavipes]|nr:hypothetical protein TNCV_1921561 [Trichonephila clavipes]
MASLSGKNNSGMKIGSGGQRSWLELQHHQPTEKICLSCVLRSNQSSWKQSVETKQIFVLCRLDSFSPLNGDDSKNTAVLTH